MKKYLVFIIALLTLSFAAQARASANFNPNHIISDAEMLDSSSMTLAEISAFLKAQNGYISKNMLRDYEGKMRTAAEIIYNAANNYDCSEVTNSSSLTKAAKEVRCKKVTINPKLLIVLLQKEQSLITEKNPTQRQLDWACGYGCPDGQACNKRWEGFGKQVNSAALQFFDYMKNPHHYSFRAGNNYRVTNTGRPSQMVNPQNNATAALYNYTPHVYYGNYNFHKLWMRYFTMNYPNGSLLQAKGEPGVWLIQNGQKRPFLSKGALTSRFDKNKIVTVSKSVLDKYPKGKGLKFPQYSLIRSPRGTVFLIVDDKKRGFKSSEAFRKIGFNPEEIINASWEDINSYKDGAHITATSSYPTGALLQDNTTGGIYWVSEGTKAPLWDSILLKTKYKWKSITPVSPEKLASYKTVEPAIFGDGELIKSNISPAVYVIDNKKRRPIVSGALFEKLGYKWTNIVTVSPKILALYEEGDQLEEIYAEEETADDTDSSSTTEETLIEDPETSTTTDEELANEINSILNP